MRHEISEGSGISFEISTSLLFNIITFDNHLFFRFVLERGVSSLGVVPLLKDSNSAYLYD